jgi:hypothetical protein
MHSHVLTARLRRWAGFLTVLGALALVVPSAEAAAKKAQEPAKPAPALQAGPIAPEQWLGAATTPLQAGEIDRLINQELRTGKITPAPRTTDEQFLRRVALDLTGQLPMPADVTEFVADRDPQKRARLIDKLLASDEYAQHWAGYWRDVIGSRLEDVRGRLLVRHFENWMTEQLKSNKGWGDITREMLNIQGEVRFDQPDKNGAFYFLGSRFGADANVERAAETSRVFLGIQIQCAQCHDHPSDVWKRQQFHELAAYFARMQLRPFRDAGRLGGLRLFAPRFGRGEHLMPAKNDPKQRTVVHPRFLDGSTPGQRLGDLQRRQALIDSIVNKKNYWFAGAYVNRIWGELMGQSFYQPIDDMGPQKDAVFASVLTRLSGAFQGSNYDMKGLFRAILNSDAYQRQTRLGESADEHLQFAASYPTRLRADALWQSLVNVLGQIGPPQIRAPRRGPFAFQGGFEGLFKQEFRFDPSLKPDEVESSIPQALMMMNSPVLNQRIQATGTNLLARILKFYSRDEDAIRMVYLRTLARKPTDREMLKVRNYVQKVGNRAEAFEDVLWALLNSAEFQTKR